MATASLPLPFFLATAPVLFDPTKTVSGDGDGLAGSVFLPPIQPEQPSAPHVHRCRPLPSWVAATAVEADASAGSFEGLLEKESN